MEGFRRVFYPGEMESEEEARRKEKGIPVSEEVLRGFLKGLKDHGLKVRDADIL